MTLEEKINRAKQLRKAAMMTVETYTDQQAAEVPTLYPVWKAGEAVEADDRRYYETDGKLYKCRQAHTTQADWTPDKTPALWAVIDVAHAGTVDDPIPASRGMDYVYGKYYRDPEDEKIYLCRREGEEEGGVINLQYLPHELIGQYFSAAESGETEEPAEPDTGDTYPEWVQPTGGHDAYNTGDIVMYNGTAYRSLIDGNVWAPDAYPQGWEVYSG